MANPYQFNQLQDQAAGKVAEALAALNRAEVAMKHAYPVGAIIEMQHNEGSETIQLEVLEYTQHATVPLDLGKGWIWCKNLTRNEPNIQVKITRHYHRFAVVSQP